MQITQIQAAFTEWPLETLREFRGWLDGYIDRRAAQELSCPAFDELGQETVKIVALGEMTYVQQRTRCGRCRACRNRAGHGPYWYVYFFAGGATRARYIGRKFQEVSPEWFGKPAPRGEQLGNVTKLKG